MLGLPQLSSLEPIADEVVPVAARKSHEVEVWFARVEPGAPEVAACLPLLSEQETARQQRFYFERDRSLYAVAHAMVRTALARQLGCAAQAITFGHNSYGRPYASGPGPVRVPAFNLSHTPGLAICAIGSRQALGIDVEEITRKTETVGIADRFFSPSEVTALCALPSDQQCERFFAYWTLKESYIKACGMGLAIPLNHFSFEVAPRQPVSISFDAARDDDPSRWHFRRYAVGSQYMVALALGSGPNQAPLVRCREWSPKQVGL